MRALALVVLGLALAGGPAVALDRLVDGFPDLPEDARDVAERSVACRHFSGEFDGTGDERDRELTRQMNRLRCDTVERDLERIHSRYREDERITRILAEAALD